jgi:hypothetical protein
MRVVQDLLDGGDIIRGRASSDEEKNACWTRFVSTARGREKTRDGGSKGTP